MISPVTSKATHGRRCGADRSDLGNNCGSVVFDRQRLCWITEAAAEIALSFELEKSVDALLWKAVRARN
jgi:hypothetical protein